MGLPSGVFSQTYEQDKAVLRTRLHWVLLFAALVGAAALPFVTSGFFLSVLILCYINLIAVLGLNILTGMAGQISLGHSAFVAVGAYTGAILSHHLGLPFWAALPLAPLMAGSIGLIFGFPSLRIKGLYLALATLAAHVIIMHLIMHLTDLTKGPMGIQVPPIALGGIEFNTDFKFYFLALAFVIIMIFLAHNIARSKLGRAFRAIRDNDLAAEVLGISLFNYKLLAFFIGCAFAGVAGILHLYWLRSVSPDPFTLLASVWYLGMVIVGGVGSTLGSVLGTVVITFLMQGATFFSGKLAMVIPYAADWIYSGRHIVFGIIVILFLLFEPRGLAHRWQIMKAYYRLWPFSY